MCGIAGWYDKQQDMREMTTVLYDMSESMKRRGPDESGIYIDNPVALIHRRLAIIDLENGKQPMTAVIGKRKYTIVYNGELYNTAELRAELESRGYRFNTHSDTEAVLLAYICWGKDCVYKLNGIFAFGIWDSEKGTLMLARDRIGVKPLFYYQYDEGIIFASEIKTLLKNPFVPSKINEEGLCELFLLGPGRTQGQGIFMNTGELLPGEYAVYDGNKLKKTRYFRLIAHEHTDSPEESGKKVRALLTDSIERQLISDVPLFCFLSGGLDSSIISYVASEYYKRNGMGVIDTYSVDYTDNSKYFKKSLFQPDPDSEFIGIIQNAISSRHHNVTIDNYDLYTALTESTTARDFPGMADVDSSLLLFCKKISENFKAGLSGECADELFGGYPWYHNKEILFEETFPWSRSLDIRKSVLRKGLLPKGEEYVLQKYSDTCNNTEKLKTDTPLEARMREMFSLNYYWFMQNLLERKDRMSMYSGLEVRVPFCDYRIVDYAYNMPWSIKAMNGREKGIVRTAFRGLLPDEIIDRKKSPYPKTHNPLYFDLCVNKVREICNDTNSPLHELLNFNGIEEIAENPEKISSPWYGQLMRAPQIMAYIIQLDFWFRKYKVQIV